MAAEIISLQAATMSPEALATEHNRVLTEIVSQQNDILEIERKNNEKRLRLQELKFLISNIDHHDKFIALISSATNKLNETLPLFYQALGAVQEARRHGQESKAALAALTRVMETMQSLVPGPNSAASASPGPLLSSFVNDFFKRRISEDGTTHQVIGQERGTVQRFLESAGDRPANQYDRASISHFLDQLRQLPVTYGKSPRDRDLRLPDLIARAEATAAPRLSDKTRKRHLSTLSQLMAFVVDTGHLNQAARTEMVEGHRFRNTKGSREQRDAWAPEELRILFKSPVWSGCQLNARSKVGPYVVRDARFWLPLLALYQGCRLEEFADLYGRDLYSENGIWAVSLVESEDKISGMKRRLKTANATRVVPLHPEILKLGFLSYVQKTAPGEADPLFPDLKPQGLDGKRGPRITRWFVEYRRSLNLCRDGVGMHAFRHTAITRLSDAIVDEQQRRHLDFAMGHGRGGSEGSTRYDKGPALPALAATMALLTYPELDLTPLYIQA